MGKHLRFSEFGSAAIRLEAWAARPGPSRRAHASACTLLRTRAERQGEGRSETNYVNVKLKSPSFSIEVTTLSPALSQTCLSLG